MSLARCVSTGKKVWEKNALLSSDPVTVHDSSRDNDPNQGGLESSEVGALSPGGNPPEHLQEELKKGVRRPPSNLRELFTQAIIFLQY